MSKKNKILGWATYASTSLCNFVVCIYLPCLYILVGMAQGKQMPVIVWLAVLFCLSCSGIIGQVSITVYFMKSLMPTPKVGDVYVATN